ncbi:helix-turn-helix domain-containing protein [Actinomadura rudentiformis]|uniref:helix-turn-helix domain-containing protein n=1 Tax=Actinomadura rudentiformis TaxID=359158 RepID=UPI001CEF9A46|nr:AraC family transcriptional regulator [Actinomadura rudentiformis]
MLEFDAGRHLSLHRPTDPTGGTAFMSSLITGVTPTAWICEDSGTGHGVEVVLAPWAAFTVFGVDMHDLAGAVVDPSDVLGVRAHQLAGALAALPGWEQRFDLLDAVLAEWIGHGRAWSPRVEWAYEALRRSRSTLTIGRLAEAVGWSRRRLEYRFQEQVGLAPKATARVFRFRHAARLLTDGWTPIRTAAACGFSDQAHLTREFKHFTDLTPTAFRAHSRAADALAAAVHTPRDTRTLALAT